MTHFDRDNLSSLYPINKKTFYSSHKHFAWLAKNIGLLFWLPILNLKNSNSHEWLFDACVKVFKNLTGGIIYKELNRNGWKTRLLQLM